MQKKKFKKQMPIEYKVLMLIKRLELKLLGGLSLHMGKK